MGEFTGDITSLWFRKGGLKLKFDEKCINTIDANMLQHISDEWNIVEETLLDYLNSKKRIGDSKLKDINKLQILQKAFNAGFNVPASYVLSSKDQLISLFSKYKKLITKPLSNLFGYLKEDNFLIHYTSILTQDDCNCFPENFFPMLVQEQIELFFEVRITVINGLLYPTAIVPHQEYVSDIRMLSKHEKRYIPLKLPSKIIESIERLLTEINCTYGCIDMIVTPDNKYYFLEINPQGQFGAFSYYSGYNIEQIISKHLH